MPSITEIVNKRSGTTRLHRRSYLARDYETEVDAIAATAAEAPSTINSLTRVDEKINATEINFNGTKSDWIVDVPWELLLGGTVSSGLNYSFQIGGTSIQRFFAESGSTTRYPAGAPDHGDAINFDGERVNGVTLPEKSGFEFVIPARKTVAEVGNTYVTTVADLYLTVNSQEFASFPAGEVLFLGMNGSRVGDDEWQLYYRFARSKNLGSFNVVNPNGANITVTSKGGWEYLWIDYAQAVVGNALVPEPIGVYVQQVFKDGNFSSLAI